MNEEENNIDYEHRYNNFVGALAAYVRTNKDYNLGAFLESYLSLDESEAYIQGLKPLPDCPTCGGKTVFHADSTDDALIVTCSQCGRVGEL